MIRYFTVLLVAILFASCGLGMHTIDAGSESGTVQIGDTTYTVTKAILSANEDEGGGEYFFWVDLLQSGIAVNGDGGWNESTSRGLFLEFEIVAPDETRQGTFTAEADGLDWVVSVLYSEDEPETLFDNAPDSGQVTISISGSTLTVHGSTVVNGESITCDYTGPFLGLEESKSIARPVPVKPRH